MSNELIVPEAKFDLNIRPATMADLPFMDRMQKANGKALGFFPSKQFEGYIETGGVLIAEEDGTAIGHCISRDRYLKRDELGVFFQLCIDPGARRKLVGAALVKAAFDRAAYGCKLYCCWCAQDLEANKFWESMGFVPIAFRAGASGKKGTRPRVHIFWQRRINERDVTTPYWYPFRTGAGAIREDRLVFPIAPGVHWKDVQAVALPVAPGASPCEAKRLHGPAARATRKQALLAAPPGKVGIVVGGRIKYVNRPGYVAPVETTALAAPVTRKKACPKGAPVKIDPKYLAAARELRDRYLEQFNSGEVIPQGKYAVGRALTKRSDPPEKSLPMLAA